MALTRPYPLPIPFLPAEEQARKLAADFGLPDLGTTELNLNRFMEHIGAYLFLWPEPGPPASF